MRRLTTDKFIIQANAIHNGYYDYSLVEYISNKHKIKIICPRHGVFEQKPNNHITNKQRCPTCAYDFVLVHNKQQAATTDEFITKAKKIHGDKYDYSLVNYVNKKTKVTIICDKHGPFKQYPSHHLVKCGCPKCNESKGETTIREYLTKNNILFIRQKTFLGCKIKNLLAFDFYLPEYNICIEYDGEQHFKPIKIFGGEARFKKQQLTDKIKTNFCYENNISLIRISYKDNIIKKCFTIIKN